jgi:hypothetical protein
VGGRARAAPDRVAGASQPAGQPVPAAPTQGAWSPSTRGASSIVVESSKGQPDGCSGSAAIVSGVFPLSRCGRIEHFCTTPARYPLQVRFYTDSMATPRPQPFRPPALSVAITFTPSGGAARRVADVADQAPRYLGAGWPLAPAFGELFSAASSQSGLLHIKARLHDPDSATTVAYRDAVPCELVPCA